MQTRCWQITKQFNFEYGHRVWSQTLNSEFSLDSKLACRHLHGHSGTVLVTLESSILQSGMVTDFKHLNFFKKWLDDVLDHKFIMDLNDPLYTFEIMDCPLQQHEEGYFTIPAKWIQTLSDSSLVEKYEGFVFVPFVPTSENLSYWLFTVVSTKLKPLDIKVLEVKLFETAKSSASYLVQ